MRISGGHSERDGGPLAVVAVTPEDDVSWIEELLRHAGLDVRRADSGQETRALEHQWAPDVLVLAADLGDVSGTEVCRALRDDSLFSPTVPVVLLMPENAARADRLEALRAGAWLCIDASSDRDELVIRLDQWLGRRRKVEELAWEGLLDPMTHLYNRQGLARRAREIASEASRRGSGLACVVFAMDIIALAEPSWFDVRSVVLRCAQVLRAHARGSDALGRMAASEFGVIASVANGGAVDALIERLARNLWNGFATTRGSLPPVSLRVAHGLASNLRYAPVDALRLLGQTSAAVVREAPRWWHPGPSQ